MNDDANNTKRVLHVFGQMFKGGAETRTMELYRCIDRTKYQFDFLVMKKGRHYYFDEIKELGGMIHYIDPPRESSYCGFISNLIRLLKNEKYYAIHAHTALNEGIVVFSAWISKVEVRIAHSRSASDIAVNKFYYRLYKYFMKMLIKLFSTEYIACSYLAGEYLFGKRMMKKEKVNYLPNAIDIDRFEKLFETKTESRKLINLPQDKVIIGTIGNLRKVKNQIYLIDVFNLYSKNNVETVLVIVGEGPLKIELIDYCKELGISENVYFLGSRDDIPRILNSYDVFLLTSLYEGLPGVIVEAQAAGIPCLISDTVTKEVDVGTGMLKYLPINQNVQAWVNSIENYIESGRLEKRYCIELLRENGFDVKKSSEMLIEIYEGKSNI